jgi:hypothetical protein
LTVRTQLPPTIEDLQRQFKLADADVDRDFGVVEIDPSDHLYAFMVDQSKAGQVTNDGSWDVKGPYSNPKIEPFGPPQ